MELWKREMFKHNHEVNFVVLSHIDKATFNTKFSNMNLFNFCYQVYLNLFFTIVVCVSVCASEFHKSARKKTKAFIFAFGCHYIRVLPPTHILNMFLKSVMMTDLDHPPKLKVRNST